MPADILVEVDGLTCTYGDFTAVDALHFHVKRGEIYALLGTNGAGKTTTLETIEGHRPVQSGQVRVFGEQPGSATVLTRTGMMLQESGFAGELTVKETVAMMGKLSGRDDDVDTVLEKTLLGHKTDTKVGQLSGGEKRRLDFATAIYGSPELIILDEPTTGLDPESRQLLWQTVNDLNAQGSTVVLTTHYLEEAENYADRIGMIHRGKLRLEGTLTELVNQFPASMSCEIDETIDIPEHLQLHRAGRTVSKQVHNMQENLYELLHWAKRNGVVLEQLKAQPSTLNDVFHTLAQEP